MCVLEGVQGRVWWYDRVCAYDVLYISPTGVITAVIIYALIASHRVKEECLFLKSHEYIHCMLV